MPFRRQKVSKMVRFCLPLPSISTSPQELMVLRMRRMTLLWNGERGNLIESTERILNRNPPHRAEPCFCGEFAQFGFRQAQRTQSFTMPGQRGGHAVEHTGPVEERADKPGILLQLVRAVELHADVAPIGPQRLSHRS